MIVARLMCFCLYRQTRTFFFLLLMFFIITIVIGGCGERGREAVTFFLL